MARAAAAGTTFCVSHRIKRLGASGLDQGLFGELTALAVHASQLKDESPPLFEEERCSNCSNRHVPDRL